jgi:hypothetical protein
VESHNDNLSLLLTSRVDLSAPRSSTVIIIIIIKMRWVVNVAHNEDIKNAHKILFGNPEGKSSLERHGFRWEDNIKIDLRGTGLDEVD